MCARGVTIRLMKGVDFMAQPAKKDDTTNINIRVETDLKHDAEVLFNELGMSLSTGVKIYLKQAVREGKLPFVPSAVPNTETIAAIEEGANIIQSGQSRFSNAEEMYKDLGI